MKKSKNMRLELMTESTKGNAWKYNECNPRDDSYCIFEKEAKENREKLDKIKELSKEWKIGYVPDIGKRLKEILEDFVK